MRKKIIFFVTFIAGLYYFLEFVLPGKFGGDFDQLRISDPFVLAEEGKYLMWYTGLYGVDKSYVGMATSEDGVRWRKYKKNPVLGPTSFSSKDYRGVSSPSIVKEEDGTYTMWYVGKGSDARYRIFRATSKNGFRWKKRGVVLDLAETKFDMPVLYALAVVKDDELYRMWCSGVYRLREKLIRGVSYATSRNGIDWTVADDNPVLVPDKESWDSTDITSISVAKDEIGFKLWYCGTNERILGLNYLQFGNIGYATSLDGISWSKAAENPVFKPMEIFPRLSEVDKLPAEDVDKALSLLGYKESEDRSPVRKKLVAFIKILENKPQPFKGWSEDEVAVVRKYYEVKEKFLPLTPEDIVPLVELTVEEKKYPDLVKAWEEKKKERDEKREKRTQFFKVLQGKLFKNLTKEREIDKEHFDSWNISSACVVRDGQGYRMFYVGINSIVSSSFVPGVARSENGVRWERVSGELPDGAILGLGKKGIESPLSKVYVTVTNAIVVIVAFAIGLGLFNLAKLHAKKIKNREKGWHNSLAFFISFFVTFIIALYRTRPEDDVGRKLYDIILFGMLASFGASSMGILSFYLASASYRAFKLKNAEAALMMITAIIIMLAQVPLGQWITHALPKYLQIQEWSGWICYVIVGAALRGVLIGATVGALVMAIRLWLSLERRGE